MITMKDIAREAGVSRPTVSLVLNGKQPKHGDLSPATRARILTIARDLGYVRNEVARSIKAGGAKVIGIVGGFDSDFRMFIVKGIAEYAQAHDCLIKLFPMNSADEIEKTLTKCLEQRVAGIIICFPLVQPWLEKARRMLEKSDLPTVLAGTGFSADWCSRVITDDFSGVNMVLNHLHSRGYERIACIAAPADAEFPCMRTAAYRRIVVELGLREHLYFVNDAILTSETDRNTLRQILGGNEHDALFCSNDIIAMKCLQVATQMRIRIPENVAVVGYGNLSCSALASVPLTTVEQPYERIGAASAEIVMNGKERLRDERLPVELVVRDSVARRGKP